YLERMGAAPGPPCALAVPPPNPPGPPRPPGPPPNPPGPPPGPPGPPNPPGPGPPGPCAPRPPPRPPRTGLMNCHTVSPFGVTSKITPVAPVQIKVLPFGSRWAPEMKFE